MNDDFKKLCKAALDNSLNPGADSRIQTALDEELEEIPASNIKLIMTITEIADYLRVSPETIEIYLGEIPCFELGGLLLFRKESVDEWINHRENIYKFEVMEFKLNKDTKRTTA